MVSELVILKQHRCVSGDFHPTHKQAYQENCHDDTPKHWNNETKHKEIKKITFIQLSTWRALAPMTHPSCNMRSYPPSLPPSPPLASPPYISYFSFSKTDRWLSLLVSRFPSRRWLGNWSHSSMGCVTDCSLSLSGRDGVFPYGKGWSNPSLVRMGLSPSGTGEGIPRTDNFFRLSRQFGRDTNSFWETKCRHHSGAIWKGKFVFKSYSSTNILALNILWKQTLYN